MIMSCLYMQAVTIIYWTLWRRFTVSVWRVGLDGHQSHLEKLSLYSWYAVEVVLY